MLPSHGKKFGWIIIKFGKKIQKHDEDLIF